MARRTPGECQVAFGFGVRCRLCRSCGAQCGLVCGLRRCRIACRLRDPACVLAPARWLGELPASAKLRLDLEFAAGSAVAVARSAGWFVVCGDVASLVSCESPRMFWRPLDGPA